SRFTRRAGRRARRVACALVRPRASLRRRVWPLGAPGPARRAMAPRSRHRLRAPRARPRRLPHRMASRPARRRAVCGPRRSLRAGARLATLLPRRLERTDRAVGALSLQGSAARRRLPSGIRSAARGGRGFAAADRNTPPHRGIPFRVSASVNEPAGEEGQPAACGETSRTRELPTKRGDRRERSLASPSEAKLRTHLRARPRVLPRAETGERGIPVGPVTSARAQKAPRPTRRRSATNRLALTRGGPPGGGRGRPPNPKPAPPAGPPPRGAAGGKPGEARRAASRK